MISLFEYYNPNPQQKNVGDCVIRALTKALNRPWEDVYTELVIQGLSMADLPSSNAVWSKYLINNGFTRYILPNNCPDCYTVEDFATDNKIGCYVLATGSHAVCVDNGVIYDSWNSTKEIPIYYFQKEWNK